MALATGELYVDLRAIADNWNRINEMTDSSVACGAVVKANAYGLGVERIAPQLYSAGCRHFFVANLKEAIQLQSLVGLETKIYVLTGSNAGSEAAFVERKLIPVIVSLEMLERWAKISEGKAGSVLKVNTGMGRLGLEEQDLDHVIQQPGIIRRAGVNFLMSHLACADDAKHPLNHIQIERFASLHSKMRRAGITLKTTFANSSGIFLDVKTHGDLVRPGIALYGGNPTKNENPMSPVVSLELPIIQLRHLPAGESVGYGATRIFSSPRVIAVVAGGYADGLLRSLSNRAHGFLRGRKVPLVGRISMDSCMFDVTEVSKSSDILMSDAIELLGPNNSIDALAHAADTISYEILTSLGSRYHRCYVG